MEKDKRANIHAKTPGVPLQVRTKLAHASTAAADTDPLHVSLLSYFKILLLYT